MQHVQVLLSRVLRFGSLETSKVMTTSAPTLPARLMGTWPTNPPLTRSFED